MSEPIGEIYIDKSADEEPPMAELLIIDSEDVTAEEVAFWREAGLLFLSDLSKISFQLRFDTPKPNEEEQLQQIVDYFVFKSNKHHKMLLLMHGGRLIGAASVFDFLSEKLEMTDTVVELSVTIVDDMQGRGLGSILLSEAVFAATQDGKTHAYTSFNGDNERSRRLVRDILGKANLVAGQTNPRDKFWRLPGVDAKKYTALERDMQLYCGDTIDDLDEQDEDTTAKRRAARLARALRYSLGNDDKTIDKT